MLVTPRRCVADPYARRHAVHRSHDEVPGPGVRDRGMPQQRDRRLIPAMRLETTLSANRTLLDVLERTATLDLPGWYLTGGCLFQTVWNVVTGRPPEHGIKDYDVF